MQSSARLIDFPATNGESVVLPRCDRHGSINIIMLARFGNVSNGAGDSKTNESFLTPVATITALLPATALKERAWTRMIRMNRSNT